MTGIAQLVEAMPTAPRRVVVPEIRSADAIRPIPGRDCLVQVHGESMGTTWSAMLYAPSRACAPQVKREIQAALDHVVSEMSPWVSHSALSTFNAAPPGTWHTLPVNFFTVLKTALAIARDSDGAFDPTIGALVNAWGFGPAGAQVSPPSGDDIERLSSRAGWRRIELDIERRRALQPGGLCIDLCGIAKGFGVDQAARALRRLGIRDFLIEVGGELRGEGVKPDGTPWWAAIEQPPTKDGSRVEASDIIVALHGNAIATSGDYRRFYKHDGVRRAHSIDPQSGRPAENGIAAVSVLHESCMQADALATAMMVMDASGAIAFATTHQIAARIVLRSADGYSELTTPAFADMMEEQGATS